MFVPKRLGQVGIPAYSPASTSDDPKDDEPEEVLAAPPDPEEPPELPVAPDEEPIEVESPEDEPDELPDPAVDDVPVEDALPSGPPLLLVELQPQRIGRTVSHRAELRIDRFICSRPYVSRALVCVAGIGAERMARASRGASQIWRLSASPFGELSIAG